MNISLRASSDVATLDEVKEKLEKIDSFLGSDLERGDRVVWESSLALGGARVGSEENVKPSSENFVPPSALVGLIMITLLVVDGATALVGPLSVVLNREILGALPGFTGVIVTLAVGPKVRLEVSVNKELVVDGMPKVIVGFDAGNPKVKAGVTFVLSPKNVSEDPFVACD